MDTRQLQAFCEVVERKSFSLAAERLGVTQPAVSLQVRSLEKRLGTQLLDRSGRRVAPTESGLKLYRSAQRLLALEEEIVSELAEEATGELEGTFEIGASTGPGGVLLSQVLCQFAHAHPALLVALSVFDTQTVVEHVADRTLELGVVGAAPRHRAVEYEPFFRDTVILACPPGHPFAGRTVTLANSGLPYALRSNAQGCTPIELPGVPLGTFAGTEYDQAMIELQAAVNAAAEKVEDPLQKIPAAIRTYLEFFDAHPQYVELFIQERANFRDRQRPSYFKHRDANRGPWRELYRALIEATAFGARVIMERFEEFGVKVQRVVNCGGIAARSPRSGLAKVAITASPMVFTTAPPSLDTAEISAPKWLRTRSKAARSPTRS